MSSVSRPLWYSEMILRRSRLLKASMRQAPLERDSAELTQLQSVALQENVLRSSDSPRAVALQFQIVRLSLCGIFTPMRQPQSGRMHRTHHAARRHYLELRSLPPRAQSPPSIRRGIIHKQQIRPIVKSSQAFRIRTSDRDYVMTATRVDMVIRFERCTPSPRIKCCK